MFGQYFIALDWSEAAKNILVFETFKENSERIDNVAVTPDNSHLILYSGDHHYMTHIFRDKSFTDSEQVSEDWEDVKL